MITGLKVASGILAALFAFETPSGCANQDKGPGEAHGVEELEQDDGKIHQVRFIVDAQPSPKGQPQQVYWVSWSLGETRGDDFDRTAGQQATTWDHAEPATTGELAELDVSERTSPGVLITCSIEVDGDILAGPLTVYSTEGCHLTTFVE